MGSSPAHRASLRSVPKLGLGRPVSEGKREGEEFVGCADRAVIAKKPLGVGSDNWAPVSEGDEIGLKDGIDGRLGQLLVSRRALSVLSRDHSEEINHGCHR